MPINLSIASVEEREIYENAAADGLKNSAGMLSSRLRGSHGQTQYKAVTKQEVGNHEKDERDERVAHHGDCDFSSVS